MTLFEQEKETGGNVRYAAKAPHKEVYGRYIKTLTAKCRKKGVEIKTNTAVTEAMIEAGKPDAVILAIGAGKSTCPVEGITSSVVCDAWQILDGEVHAQGSRCHYRRRPCRHGNGRFSAGKGRQGYYPGGNAGRLHRFWRWPRMAICCINVFGQPAIKLLFGHDCKTYYEEGSVVVTQKGEEQDLNPSARLIVAIGVTPRDALKDLLAKKGIRHFIVGDAAAPRRIIEATTEGAKAAWEI